MKIHKEIILFLNGGLVGLFKFWSFMHLFFNDLIGQLWHTTNVLESLTYLQGTWHF